MKRCKFSNPFCKTLFTIILTLTLALYVALVYAQRNNSQFNRINSSSSFNTNTPTINKVGVAKVLESKILTKNWAQQINSDYNLYRVAPNFYRSRQIDNKALAILQKLGITTVVNLRANHSDDEYLTGTNIRMVHIPIHTWNIEDEDIVAALLAVREGEMKGAVLLHCQHGADRTGVVSAMYRIIYQGWTRQQAIDELKNGGFGFHSIWVNIPIYIEHVDLEKIKKEINSKM